jgi:hypothetical protein
VLEDERLVEGGFVYLFEEGKRRTKRMDELCPLDAPAVLAENGEDRGRERQLHKERSAVYAIEYGGRKLVTSDPGDGVGYPVPMRTPLGRSLPARRLTCDFLPRLCGFLHLAYPGAHAPRAGPSSPQKMSTFGCAPFSLARHGIKASLSASKRFLRSHLTRGWGYEGVPDGLRRSTS